MSGHDHLCRARHMSVTVDISDMNGCDCALIAKVRADEREAVARWKAEATEALSQWPAAVADAARRELRADLRARVQAMDALLPRDGLGPYALGLQDTYRVVIALIDGSGAPDHPEATCSGKEMADLRAGVQELRDRPIASFDGYTGRDALDQVLALIDGGRVK